MKTVILSVWVAMSASFAFSQNDTLFRDISLEQAIGQSSIENKPVLLMCYEDWCAHCEKMLEEVFTDTSVMHYYGGNFICLKQDMSEGNGPKLAKRFYVTSFPTFVFLNKNNEVIYQIVGEQKAQDFIRIGKDASEQKNQLPYLAKKFETDPSDSVNCFKYLTALSRARMPSQSIADIYFNLHKDNFEFSLANWKIFNISISDMQSEEFRFILDHKKEFSDAVTEARVDRKLYKTAAYNLQSAATPKDTAAYNKQKNIASTLHLFSVDSIIFVSDISIAERNKNYSAFSATALAGAEKYIWNDYAQLRHISDIFLNFVTDTEALEKAAGFAERSAEIKPEYGNTLLAAKLYFKSGNKQKAKLAAEAAKAISVKMQTNGSEADTLISKCN